MIVRLVDDGVTDGELHGVVEEIGGTGPRSFGDGRTLLALLRARTSPPEGDLNPTGDGGLAARGGVARG